MLVGGICPARGRHCDERVRKVDEDVDQMPMPKRVSIRVWASLDPFILLVAAHHVMADQEAGAVFLRSGQGRIEQREVAFVKYEVG